MLGSRPTPKVSPLPPYVTFEQAKHFMSALVQVDPAETSIVANTARQVLAGILPCGKS